MNAIRDLAIMVDCGASVDDARASQGRTDIDYATPSQEAASANLGAVADAAGRVYYDGERCTRSFESQGPLEPRPIVADTYDDAIKSGGLTFEIGGVTGYSPPVN